MVRKTVCFLGYLLGTGESLSKIPLQNGYRIRALTTPGFSRFLSQVMNVSEEQVRADLKRDKILGISKHVIIEKSFELDIEEHENKYERRNLNEERLISYKEGKIAPYLKAVFRTLLLFKEGLISLFFYHFYYLEGEEIIHIGVGRNDKRLSRPIFYIADDSELENLKEFMKQIDFRGRDKSLEMALDSFEESYLL
jgi:hypothetical protein